MPIKIKTLPFPHRSCQRPSAEARGYGYAWGKVRAAWLEANPWCVVCGVRATIADHVHAKRLGGAEAGNLQSMCQTCHNRKIAVEKAIYRAMRNIR